MEQMVDYDLDTFGSGTYIPATASIINRVSYKTHYPNPNHNLYQFSPKFTTLFRCNRTNFPSSL